MRKIARIGLRASVFVVLSAAYTAPALAEPVSLALKPGDQFAWTRRVMETRERKDLPPNFSEAASPFSLQVVEATERGYIVELAHGEATFGAPPDIGLRALMQLLQVSKLRFELTKAGQFGAFLNRAEFRAQLDNLVAPAGSGENDEEIRNYLQRLAGEDQGVRNLVLRGAASLFSCVGHDPATREPEMTESQIPNGTEGAALRAKQTVAIHPSEDAADRAEVYILQRSTKESYVDFLDGLAAKSDGASLPPDVVKFLKDTAEDGAIQADYHARCDMKTGVSASAEAVFTVTVPGAWQKREERFEAAR